MSLLLLGILIISTGFDSSAGLSQPCCTSKTVGGVPYTLLDYGVDVPKACHSSCVYQQDNTGQQFCFAPGHLSVVCTDGYDGCCHYVEASGKNYTLLNQDALGCECTYRLVSDYTHHPEGFCFSSTNSTCLDAYLANNLCLEINAGNWKVYNWWQAIGPCFSQEFAQVGRVDSALCMKSPDQAFQKEIDDAVDMFQKAVADNSTLTALADSMWENVPEFYTEFCPGNFSTYTEYLRLILSKWPQFKVGAPTSSTLVCYIHTQAGRKFFASKTVNHHFTQLVGLYNKFLDSKLSLEALNKGPFGWISPCAQKTLNLQQFKINTTDKHFGFKSFNEFFSRELNESYPYSTVRPIAGLWDDTVIVSPGDFQVYNKEKNVSKETVLYIKNESYSLLNIFAGNESLTDYFVGGSILQGFFHTTSYHWFHAPVEGTVEHAQVVPGLLMAISENNVEDYDGGDQTGSETEKINYWLQNGQNGFSNSQLYLAHVSVRGIVIINSANPNIGRVCALAIGMEEVSSVKLTVKSGDIIKKGEPLGYFQYGGSSGLVIVEKKLAGFDFGPIMNEKLKMGQRIMKI